MAEAGTAGRLVVSREHHHEFQPVGMVFYKDSSLAFSYHDDYLATADAAEISLSLPLDGKDAQPAGFFEGLLPEGEMRGLFANSMHVSARDYANMLARLNSESIGALVLSRIGEPPCWQNEYEEIDFSFLEDFAAHPKTTALNAGMATRLSLAGAQSKLGLRHSGTDFLTGWALPVGFSPTTHILKAADGTFENQVLNEAICLEAARLCDFDVASSQLRPTSNGPILATRRFDRAIDDDGTITRLHQEDLCQAAGLLSEMKYEPTDGHFAALASSVISKSSNNPFGDRIVFFERLLFDYLIGNCDNHLKNYSLVWNASWTGRELSPSYDISCTTIYPVLDREMGIALCPSRRIDNVTAESILETARGAGIPRVLAESSLKRLASQIGDAVMQAGASFEDRGFRQAAEVAQLIFDDAQRRIAICLE